MSLEVFTVLGANGFIGKSLAAWLHEQGHEVHTPERDLTTAELIASVRGHVLYCIGLTADFRRRPWDTVDAHVCILREILAGAQFSSLTYLSSTRVYLGCKIGHEDAALTVQPNEPDQLYNLSKLLGESLCHAAHTVERPVRVVRLSNVIGSDIASENFIYVLLREALSQGVIQLNTSLDSAKDYIALEDVTRMLEQVAIKGQSACYNLASGHQTTNLEIVQLISKLTGSTFSVDSNASQILLPPIDIHRLREEFDFKPVFPLNSLAGLDMDALKKTRCINEMAE